MSIEQEYFEAIQDLVGEKLVDWHEKFAPQSELNDFLVQIRKLQLESRTFYCFEEKILGFCSIERIEDNFDFKFFDLTKEENKEESAA